MLRLEGRIANHDTSFDGAIEIDTTLGLITHVGPKTGHSDLDLGDATIFPGFGDIHIHARDDVSKSQVYKEDFATMSAASVHGGVAHVADMPNNPIAPVDDARY
jgi:dihydroorotase